jgi:hypothetical protein
MDLVWEIALDYTPPAIMPKPAHSMVLLQALYFIFNRKGANHGTPSFLARHHTHGAIHEFKPRPYNATIVPGRALLYHRKKRKHSLSTLISSLLTEYPGLVFSVCPYHN